MSSSSFPHPISPTNWTGGVSGAKGYPVSGDETTDSPTAALNVNELAGELPPSKGVYEKACWERPRKEGKGEVEVEL